MLADIAPSKRVFLAGQPGARLIGAHVGAARIVADGPEYVVPLGLLDTFDAQVSAAGHLLVSVDGGLWMVPADAPTITQDGGRPGFVQQMAAGPVADRLAAHVDPLRTLLPLAGGQLARQDIKMIDDLDKVAARCRLWRFETGPDRSVTLIAFRPVRGHGPEMAELKRLVASFGAPLASPGAAARRLAGPEAAYTNKPVTPMTSKDRAFDVANAFLRANLSTARRNEDGVIRDLDTEFLHDYRVSLRRIRSVLSLFKEVYTPARTEALKARFSALMADTGRLRDLDVYMLERDRYAALVPEPFRPGIEALFDHLAADRTRAQSALSARFRSQAYLDELASLTALLKHSDPQDQGPRAGRKAYPYAQALIWKRYRKVCKIARGIDDDTPDGQVHALRIQCKKLRYLIEFFAPLFDDKDTQKVVKSLKRLQNTLGNFNDYSVQQVELLDILARLDEDSSDVITQAAGLGALVSVLHQKQLEERGRVAASFAAFDAPGTRHRVRALFKPGKSAR